MIGGCSVKHILHTSWSKFFPGNHRELANNYQLSTFTSRVGIYLFGFYCHFQHCIGNIKTGSSMGRGNWYIQLVKFLYCKLPTISKKLPSFPQRVRGLNRGPQRSVASVLPLQHHDLWVGIKCITHETVVFLN